MLSAIAGFLLAAKGHVHPWLLISAVIGTSLVIASACVFNNYIDRGIDVKMARTKKRALVSGTIKGRNALIYATILGVLGFCLLLLYVNVLVAVIGAVGFVDYVVLYGLSKRGSVHGTIVGSISGAAPILAGYAAVTDRIDGGAILLFLILVIWQMPHFYAIATYRLNDYKEAGLPVLPVEKGIRATKVQILLYIIAFIIATLLLTIFGYTGYPYFVVMAIAGLVWLWYGLQGFRTGKGDDTAWARKMFFISLIVLTAFCLMLSINSVL